MGEKTQKDLMWSESYLLEYRHNKTFVNGNSSVQVWFNIHFNAKNPREISGSERYSRVRSTVKFRFSF